MANIALDIKANTSKALGEFKKLSRELDNKFLVQGLKLDVVKNAFRQINREFEQSLGQQGFNTTETTNQLQRNAAANLAILNKLGTDAANEVTRSVRKNLQFLQAEGKITGETVKEALTAASFFDFSGSEAEVKKQFQSFANNFAEVSQDLSDAFGESGAGQFQKVLTGQASLDDLFGVDFGPGGASKNLILKAIRENYGNIDAVTGEARTRLIEKILADFQDTNTAVGKILDDQKRAARRDDPFRQINRELQGLFSPQGLFGNLRQIGGTFANLDGEQVPRNLLQLTAKLIRTIFDKDDGLFAVLGKTLGDAFGFDPKNILAPILNGVELFTLVLERLRDFFRSASFKKFLKIFDPLRNAIEGISFENGLSGEEISNFINGLFESIKGLFKNITEFISSSKFNNFIDGLFNGISELFKKVGEFISSAEFNNFIDVLFDGIRGLFRKISEFIKGIDAKAIGDVIGNFIGQVIASLPDLLTIVFNSITKLIDIVIATLNSDGFDEGAIGKTIATFLDGLVGLIPKVIELIGTALPKILGALGSAFNQADGSTKAVIATVLGTLLTNQLVKLFTGEGILSNIKKKIGEGLERIPGIGRFFRGKSDASAARGSDRDRWERLFQKLDRIIECVCGGGILDAAGDFLDPRRRRGGSSFSRRGGGGFSTRRGPSARRPRLPFTQARVSGLPPRGRLGRLGNLFSSFFGGARVTGGGNTPGVFSRLTGRVPQLTGDVASRIPPGSARITGGAPVGGIRGALADALKSTRNFFGVGGPRVTGATTPSGLTNLFRSFKSSVSTLTENAAAQSRILRNQFGAGFNKPNIAVGTSAAPSRAFRAGEIARNLQRGAQSRAGQISTQVSRATQAGGGLVSRILGGGRNIAGRAAGGLRRIPLLGPLLSGLAIASVVGAPGANAGELEEQGYTKEEIEKIKKDEGRNKTRGVLGVLGGIGGGALAGAGVGAALGAAGANPFTVAVGGVLGSIVGGIIGEEAVNALGDDIIDGVMGFAGQVGGFFSGLWGNISSGFSSALDGIGKFFGTEGPIQRFARWYFSLPGNIAGGIFGAITGFFGEDGPIAKVGDFFKSIPEKVTGLLSEAWTAISSAVSDAPTWLLAGLLGPLGIAAAPLISMLKGEKEPTPNFAGGFNLIGGRTAFNEREAIGMPDGVTYIPLTSSTTLDKFVGKTIETTNNMEVIINVNGASDPRQVAQAVIEEIDNVFKSVTSTT